MKRKNVTLTVDEEVLFRFRAMFPWVSISKWVEVLMVRSLHDKKVLSFPQKLEKGE